MSKYQDLHNATWENATLYAESIPHLFHWDLCYLWMLEKVGDAEHNEHVIPEVWRVRLEAWRRLAALFLLGELDAEEEKIGVPFIQHTRAYGISSVHWVRVPKGDVIGVFSPVVLVRPLPDFSPGDMESWPASPLTERTTELAHFAKLACSYLRKDQSPSSFRARLARVLERNLVQDPGLDHLQPRGGLHSVSLLRQLKWTQGASAGLFDNVELLLRDRHSVAGARVYVPRCSYCGGTLLRMRKEAPQLVSSDSVELECPACRQPNDVALSDFMIWYRSTLNERSGDVILWERGTRTLSEPPQGYRPQKTTVEGAFIHFEWNPALVGGEQERRFLSLSFPDRTIREYRLEDILYKKLLVIGAFDKFDGLPVRKEWEDALIKPAEVQIQRREELPRIQYDHLRLNGWPMPISLSYSTGQVVREPELGAGIYPDPRGMTDSWKWYRIFIDDLSEVHAPRKKYRVEAPDGKNLLPWLQESKSGCPAYYCVSHSEHAEIGVMLRPEVSSPAQGTRAGDANVTMGVDFGTTNSVVYALWPGQSPSRITANDNGVLPSKLHTAVQWQVLPAREEGKPMPEVDVIADFLPGSQYAQDPKLRDAFIIPSALWALREGYIVRWGNPEPVEEARAYTTFKFDLHGVDNRALRTAYLSELILLTLPYLLKQAGVQAKNVAIGMAYPLAFGYAQREEMKTLLEDLDATLRDLTGLNYQFYSINESMACVKAYGQFKPGESFLIADMGGGTMDVALLTVRGVAKHNIHQIGSIRYAGEIFISALGTKTSSGTWPIRDKIRLGQIHDTGDLGQKGRAMLTPFTVFALEFLRTMAAAFIHNINKQEAEGETKQVSLILVGNGWHLVEALSTETKQRGPDRVFKEHYGGLIARFDDKIALHSSTHFQDLPSSKHLVVIGALTNARFSQLHEVEGKDVQLSKLPAGRSFRITLEEVDRRIPWHELVGDGITLDGISQSIFSDAIMEFDFASGPPTSREWANKLREVFKSLRKSEKMALEGEIPYPEEPFFRQEVVSSVEGDDPIRITKSLLQIILEKFWSAFLSK